jgi:hypothetical protein
MKSKILNYDFLYLMRRFFLFIFSQLFLSYTVLRETPYFLSFLCIMVYLTVVLKCCSAYLCGNKGVIPSEEALIQ